MRACSCGNPGRYTCDHEVFISTCEAPICDECDTARKVGKHYFHYCKRHAVVHQEVSK